MNRKLLYGLILLVIVVLILIFNQGDIKLNVLFATMKLHKSLVLLVFACVGGVIGFLLSK